MAGCLHILYRLREDADRDEFERWVAEVDLPVAGRIGAIRRYAVTRLGDLIDGDGARYDYLETLEVTSLDEYRAAAAQEPEFQRLLEEWSGFVAEYVVVPGEVIAALDRK